MALIYISQLAMLAGLIVSIISNTFSSSKIVNSLKLFTECLDKLFIGSRSHKKFNLSLLVN